ncbi:MAG: hypothetical protein ACYDBB_00790 [Armatimonadota bacterium]
MRSAFNLTLFIVFLLILPRSVRAQEITFAGSTMFKLANAIATSASKTNAVPTGYKLKMENGAPMIINAANAFELLLRCTIEWSKGGEFPKSVPLMIDDLNGYSIDPRNEPGREGLQCAVSAAEIGTYSPVWLKMAEEPGHKILRAMTFENHIKLTGAQFLVAIATLMNEANRDRNRFPAAIVVPMVHSPANWLDTRQQIDLTKDEKKVEDKPEVQLPQLRILLNGVDITRFDAAMISRNPLPPFCGTLRIEITGTGNIDRIRFILEDKEYAVLKGLGPHTLNINTLTLPDGVHTLSATAIDPKEMTYGYAFSYNVKNGREPGRSPMEHEDKDVQAVPADAEKK